MCNPALRREIEEFVDEIYKLRGIPPLLPEDWELALEVHGEADERICSYYFVCHPTRCLFWLHELDLKDLLGNLSGVTDETHVRESAHVSGIHQTERMTRPGVTISVLVSVAT